ncbi:MAG: FAD-dependent oxidoreductase [Bryobacterales bacterium]|nr:FAD-dependent oxidoreductase [Bryobacterales bacterium]
MDITTGLETTQNATGRIVIIGGGFAGIELAKRLEKKLPAENEIVVISADNHMVFTPMLPEVAARTLNPLHIVVTGREMTRRTVWMKARVSSVNTSANEVTYEDDRGEEHRMRYGQLVIACGAVVNLDAIPGMGAHAYPLKSIGDAFSLGNALIGLCEDASVASEAERPKILSVVVVGAGFSGVEIAGNIADLVDRVHRYYPKLRGLRARITLLQRGKRVLPELAYQSLSDFAYKKLQERGVDVRLGTSAREVTRERVILGSGESIPAGLVICTIGTSANPLIETVGVPLVQKRLPTEADMRVTGLENVWAIGDSAFVPNAATGECSPPTAQFALRQAQQLAGNLVRHLEGKATSAFHFKPLGLMAAIGHRNAVAEVFGLQLSGFLAWFLWRGVYLSKMPSLSRKFQIAVDWAWELLFPPNSVELSPQSERKTDLAHFAGGDWIYRKGDPAQHLFLVQKGTAAIYFSEAEGPIGTLEPGDHFGENALLNIDGRSRRSVSVRAISPVDVIRMRREDFVRLADSMSVLRRSMAREYLERRSATQVMEMLLNEPGLFDFRVERFMTPECYAIPDSSTLGSVLAQFEPNTVGFNIVDASGCLTGYVSRTELYEAMQRRMSMETPIADFMLKDPPLATPDDNAIAATLRLVRNDVELLPVVEDLAAQADRYRLPARCVQADHALPACSGRRVRLPVSPARRIACGSTGCRASRRASPMCEPGLRT